ncbi:MAG: hypothetical protein NVS3B5_21870 [Sphingomicrobium sp.]
MKHLIPEKTPGTIVVADNLPAHKVAGIRKCLEDAGMGLLYLPPYSPDFNPIEQAFQNQKTAPTCSAAILRSHLRRAQRDPQKVQSECANYLRHSG